MNKAKEIRDSCQLTCICKTCGNEQGGVCALGSCESAREMDRCPLTKCHYCVGEKVATIADKVRELREAFREQYGVEVNIQINAYDTVANPHLTHGIAEKLGTEMAKVFPGQPEVGHRKGDVTKWFKVAPPWEERVGINIFYGYGEEEPHEQSN